MSILHRYLFKSVLLASLMAVGLFTFVLLVGNVLRDVAGLMADGRLGFGLFVQLLALLIPYVVAYALPLGMLTGVLLVLGRLSAQREITAMRCAGLSLARISAPVFFLAILAVAFAVIINFYYAPTARGQYREILSQAIRHNPLDFVVEKTFIRNFPGYILYIGDREGEELSEIWVWELDDERRVTKLLRAQSGSFTFDSDAEALILRLVRGSSEFRGRDPENALDNRPPLEFEEAAVRLPLEELLGRRTVSRRLSLMTFGEITGERQRILAAMAEEGAARDMAALIRVQMSIHERFAMSWSIISLTMIAIPLGITIQRKETSANLVVALLLALFFYFLIIVISWFERKPEVRPDLLMWGPNILFQMLGIWLFIRSERR